MGGTALTTEQPCHEVAIELTSDRKHVLCSWVSRGVSRISGKGVHMYKGVGDRFANLISFCLKYLMKMK